MFYSFLHRAVYEGGYHPDSTHFLHRNGPSRMPSYLPTLLENCQLVGGAELKVSGRFLETFFCGKFWVRGEMRQNSGCSFFCLPGGIQILKVF